MKYILPILCITSMCSCVPISISTKRELDRNAASYIEIKNTYDISDWKLNLKTNAMLYIYEQTASNQPSVIGGIGLSPKDKNIYVQPNRDTSQMILSVPGGSSILWPPDLGVNYRAVYTQTFIRAESLIHFMKGYGPSSNYNLWVRIDER